jgi:hypothetical protein
MKPIFFWHVADFILPLAYSASIAILLVAAGICWSHHFTLL